MTEAPDPPPTIATMRTIGMVWAVVGGLAIIVGAIATVFAIVIFGVLALALGVALVAIQRVRARSAIRASRTLTNTPPPPAAPPSASPPEPPGPPSGPPGRPTTASDLRGSRGDRDAEAPVGSPGRGPDDGESIVIDAEPEDGTGSASDEDDPPRRDA